MHHTAIRRSLDNQTANADYSTEALTNAKSRFKHNDNWNVCEQINIMETPTSGTMNIDEELIK